jgi:hypothetical protein
MSNKSNAVALSDILRYMANKIEENPEIIENLKIDVKLKQDKPAAMKIDLSGYDTEEKLYNALKKKNIKELKSIIKENKLGKDYSTSKLTTRSDLIKFIIKRVNDRYHKGDSFSRPMPEKE